MSLVMMSSFDVWSEYVRRREHIHGIGIVYVKLSDISDLLAVNTVHIWYPYPYYLLIPCICMLEHIIIH